MTSLRVGFIGLGSMGGRIASRLARVSNLCVYDAVEAALEPFRDIASVGSSIADVGRDADIVGICVRNGAQVDECVDALVPVMRSGSVLMICSTISPVTVRAVAARAASGGIDVIDTPVTTTGRHPTEPFVLTMTSGDERVVERGRPLLDAYSTDTIHVGPLGSAMALKIINNLVTEVEIVVAEEAFRLAALSSVPAESLKTVMTRNGTLSPPMAAITQMREDAVANPATRAHLASQAGNGVKDLALAEELAISLNTPSATATFAKGQIRTAMEVPEPTE